MAENKEDGTSYKRYRNIGEGLLGRKKYRKRGVLARPTRYKPPSKRKSGMARDLV